MNTTETPTIWFAKSASATIAQLNAVSANTVAAHMGIEYIEVGCDFLRATLPVD